MLGANAELPSKLIVMYPLENAKDASNYLLSVQQVDIWAQEAPDESVRRAGLGILLLP